MIGWVNRNEYEQTTETFSILPLSEDMRTKLGMPYHSIFAKETKMHHCYLAQGQQTCIAILPVHTRQERSLYRCLSSSQMVCSLAKNSPTGLQLLLSGPNMPMVSTSLQGMSAKYFIARNG